MTLKAEVKNYKTLVFDCDGVILNSNNIKTEAFYHAAKIYGHEAAQELKNYHVKNGGISRYRKFEYFLTEILGEEAQQKKLNKLLDRFSRKVKDDLFICDIAGGIKQLKKRTPHANWLIVSGGDQNELRSVFAGRDLNKYFDGGVFGSPDTKETILNNEINLKNIAYPALFIGDSKYDYTAARAVNIDFIFVSDWSEVVDWEEWVNKNQLDHVRTISDL